MFQHAAKEEHVQEYSGFNDSRDLRSLSWSGAIKKIDIIIRRCEFWKRRMIGSKPLRKR